MKTRTAHADGIEKSPLEVPPDGTEVDLLGELAAESRRIAREEIASLCGLMLNRLGNSGQPGAALMRGAWGEALADFSERTGGGDEPGPEAA